MRVEFRWKALYDAAQLQHAGQSWRQVLRGELRSEKGFNLVMRHHSVNLWPSCYVSDWLIVSAGASSCRHGECGQQDVRSPKLLQAALIELPRRETRCEVRRAQAGGHDQRVQKIGNAESVE